MAKQGKKYVAAAQLVDRNIMYSVTDAIALARKADFTKFNASVELSFRLNVDPRHADQQIRGAVVLPHGTGLRSLSSDFQHLHFLKILFLL